MNSLRIRNARPDDLERVAAIEAACFPAAEAAPREAFRERIAAFPESFLVAELDGAMIGFINGCATNSPILFDDMFHDTSHHAPDGENLTVFGLDVDPEHRRQGVAAQLMLRFIEVAREAGKRAVILTCKERLIPYYESFGYVNLGPSASEHGGAQWFDLSLDLGESANRP